MSYKESLERFVKFAKEEWALRIGPSSQQQDNDIVLESIVEVVGKAMYRTGIEAAKGCYPKDNKDLVDNNPATGLLLQNRYEFLEAINKLKEELK